MPPRANRVGEPHSAWSAAQAAPGVRLAQLSPGYHARAAGAGVDFDHFAIAIAGAGIATETERRLIDLHAQQE